MDEPARPRPISVVRKEGILSPNRPTLDDVLNNNAPPPYTLAAYTAFLSQQHCLETLEFVTEARKYGCRYDEAVLARKDDAPLTTESDDGFELTLMWNRLLDVYVKPGAPREINLPAEERDDLVEYPCEPNPAPPAALDPAIKRMYDLMSDSIFIPFCNSLRVPSHAQTYSAISELSKADFDPSRMTYHDRSGISRRGGHNRRESPPAASPSFSPSRSPPQHRSTHSSTLSNALNRTSASNRLSTHVSHSSAASDTAMTDASDPDDTAVMTPPTTPPSSELGGPAANHHHSHPGPTTQPTMKPHRSESGAWKKTMKFFGGGSSSGKKGRD